MIAQILAATAAAAAPAPADTPAPPHVILVHGATMDGSSWRQVFDRLRSKGLSATVVQLPLTGLADDVAETARVIAQTRGPVVLVGHSYGGAVISVAGTAPTVRSLVYVAAFQPDVGESIADLAARSPLPGHPKMVSPSAMIVEPAWFRADVAADLPEADAAFLAAAQRPTAAAAFTTRLTAAAWRGKPSWAVIAGEDKTIAPALQRFMSTRSKATVTEVAASHLVQASAPDAVAQVIEAAAKAGGAD